MSAVTKSGTNTFTGSVFGFGRADWLSSSYDIRGNKSTSDFSTYQYGFSLGGPIVKDRAHFYVVWDHQQDSRPIYIADIKTAADESRYNVTQSTLDRYLDIAVLNTESQMTHNSGSSVRRSRRTRSSPSRLAVERNQLVNHSQ